MRGSGWRLAEETGILLAGKDLPWVLAVCLACLLGGQRGGGDLSRLAVTAGAVGALAAGRLTLYVRLRRKYQKESGDFQKKR